MAELTVARGRPFAGDGPVRHGGPAADSSADRIRRCRGWPSFAAGLERRRAGRLIVRRSCLGRLSFVVVRRRPAVLPERGAHRHPGGRGARVRQSAGNLAPRRQAVEPASGQSRQCLGCRFRAGQDGGGRRPDAHRATFWARSGTWLPERFSGQCDARSDVYSLGLTLYELVALRPAYEASDRHALIERVLHEDPERLKKRAPGVPRDLETIVAKATARDPAARYDDGGGAGGGLAAVRGGPADPARRVSPAERFARWCRRNKVLAASIGVAAAALVAVAVFVATLRRPAGPPCRRASRGEPADHATGGRPRERERRPEERARPPRRPRWPSRTAGWRCSISSAARPPSRRGRSASGCSGPSSRCGWRLRRGDEAGRHVALANLSAWRRHHVELKEVFLHGNAVKVVAFSPDGKTILTGGNDKTARLWHAATGRPIGQPMKHSEWVISAAFSPDGKTILTGARTRRRGCGTPPPAGLIGQPMKHSECGVFRGVQPGRHDDPHRDA